MDTLNKYIPNSIEYVKSTFLFVFLVTFISIPVYSISQQNLNLLFLYVFSSYFITIIAISISYYHYFKEEWKSKINIKMLLFYLLLHQVSLSFFFYIFNSFFGITTQNIYVTAILSYIGGAFFMWMDAGMIERPLRLSMWIFRSFDGKALTFRKEIHDINQTNTLLKFLYKNSFYQLDKQTGLVHEGSFSHKPTHFLCYDKVKGVLELQITKQKWFIFFIDETLEDLKDVLGLLGFEYLGVKDIHNPLFVSDHAYPKFSKSKKFTIIWFIFGIAILTTNIILINDTLLLNYATFISNKIFGPFNLFVAENQGLALIIAAIIGGIISHIDKIKPIFEKIIQSFKDM